MSRAFRIVGFLCLLIMSVGCGEQGARDRSVVVQTPPPSAAASSPENPQREVVAAESLPPEIQKDVADVAERQSQGLKGSKTIVRRAFEFRQQSRLQPIDAAKLVAVDVEFQNYTKGFDLDDVDVLDGDGEENYGSDPEIKFLNPDGALADGRPDFDDPTTPLRVLLIYAVPKKLKSIKLEYWGDRLVAEATPITQGSLKYDESRILPDLKFWPYPGPSRLGDTYHRGRWLLCELYVGDGATVVDLEAWPPTFKHWDCNVLNGIEPAPNGGWVMLTRTGSTSDDIRFPVWLHPDSRPGASPLAGGASGPRGHLKGIGVIGDRIFAQDGKFLYWFVAGKLERDDALGEARGVTGIYSTEYTHGTVSLADGRKLLIFDGDGYELVDGKFKKTWPLGINEPYEFKTLPWGRDGFYFLENRMVYRIKPGAKREEAMTGVKNVMAIESGPDESI